MVQRPQHVPQPQPVEPVIQGQPEVILVDRNNNADEVVRDVQQQNIEVHNNIANLVENIMAQNGLNIGLLISVKKELNRLYILGTLITCFASYPAKSSQILKNHSIMLFTSNANSL